MKILGYEFNWQNEGNHPHMVFVKGYNILSPKEQIYHIHAGPANHPIWDRLLFKNYLIDHPQTAKEYEQLKLKLSADFRHEGVATALQKPHLQMQLRRKPKQ